MNTQYLELSNLQVALAAAMIAVNAAISLWLKLGLERKLAWASIRTVGQLLLIGLILKWIFAVRTLPLVLLLMVTMTGIAGVAAVSRAGRRYPGIYRDSIISAWSSSWLVAAVALTVVVSVHPWYEPQYAIPLLGMLLGNTMNGISIGIDHLPEDLLQHRNQIETALALGATRHEAARDSVRNAIRSGMIPILNSMMVVGIVSLPGMMTGQLLAGIDPMQAVRYQIVIMFLIASTTALGTMGAVLLGFRRLFNADHQFLFHRITKRK